MTPANDILNRMRIADGVYLVGVFVRGVTIFKQQIRSLNLIWALKQAGHISTETRVGIIGGGFAGLTAAAALLTQRPRELYIFEKRAVFCPLQQGCDIRWVHPHIYDWPAQGSLRPVAGLPLMNWREGRASDVAYQLLAEWRHRRSIAAPHTRVVEVLQLRHLQLEGRRIEWVGLEEGSSSGESKEFDLVIVAIGFGHETAPTGLEATSYWRNEDLNQPHLGDQRNATLISGTGDGGFIDLLRARLIQFRQDTVITELFGDLDDTAAFIKTVHSAFQRRRPATNLFEAFSRLPHLDALVKEVRGRLRQDNDATLQVRHTRQLSALFGHQASFLNNLLIFLLYRAGGFALRFGELNRESAIGYKPLVIRHGTDRDTHLRSIFRRAREATACLNRAKRHQDAAGARRTDIPAWPAGWWDRAVPEKGHWQQEYAPAATVSIATAFASSLNGVLASSSEERFRATLHRVMHVGQEAFLQQVAYYSGTRLKGGEPYRAFPLTRGLIGHCARTAAAWRTWKHNNVSIVDYRRRLTSDIRALRLDEGGAQPMDEEVLSLLVVPLLHASPGVRPSVAGVLFVDSTGLNTFTDDLSSLLVRSLSGFCRFLDNVALRRIREVETVDVVPDTAGTSITRRLPRLRTIERLNVTPPTTRLPNIDLEWSRELRLYVTAT
jgi:hypothetical protein